MAMLKLPLKAITIYWKEGGSTSLTVHESTDVLAAYEPVLSYIDSIVETTIKDGKVESKHIHESEKEE